MAIEQNFGKKIYILLSVVVGIYILLRAVYFPVLNDEVATFFMYVQTGRFLPPDIAWDANNHILNSALTRVTYLLFGPSIFALRLPALLFVPVYFYYVYKTGSLIRHSVVRWAFYLSMIGTHYIISYLGYSRGYGMSLVLLTVSAWYLINTVQAFKVPTVFKTLVFAFLAVSANLNLIITYLIIFGLLVFYSILNLRRLRIGEIFLLLFVFLFGGLGIWFFTDYSFTLLEKGRFYCGSADGFWDNTVLSLAALVFNNLAFFFALYFVAIIILSVIVNLVSFLKKWEDFKKPSPGFLFLILIIGNIVAAYAMHLLFGVLYQEDRTAMYYLPLFFGLAGFTVDLIVQQKGKLYLFILLPLFFLPVFSLSKISLVQSYYDSVPYVPYSFFEEVSSSTKPEEYPPTVAGIHKRKLVWAYYNYLSGGIMNPVLFSDEPVMYADYLMYDFDEREKPLELYDEIKYDEHSGLSLMKRRLPLTKVVLSDIAIKKVPLSLNKEYYGIAKIPIDTLDCNALSVCFDFEIESETVPFEGTIVCELRDSAGATIHYEAINLDQMRAVWKPGSNTIHHTLLLSPVPQNSVLLQVYFWNKRKVDYQILKGKTVVMVTQ